MIAFIVLYLPALSTCDYRSSLLYTTIRLFIFYVGLHVYVSILIESLIVCRKCLRLFADGLHTFGGVAKVFGRRPPPTHSRLPAWRIHLITPIIHRHRAATITDYITYTEREYHCFKCKGVMSTKPVFEKIEKIAKVVCSLMWTYDICAFDTGTYYDYYWQKLWYFAVM